MLDGHLSFCKECKAVYSKQRYEKDKERFYLEAAARNYKRKYNITLGDYDEMFEAQSGVCELCGNPETTTRPHQRSTLPGPIRLAVDHDHTTGKVRNLLCAKCNVILGVVENNLPLVKNCFEGLKNHSGLEP